MTQLTVQISVLTAQCDVTEQSWKWTCESDGENLSECHCPMHTCTAQRNVSEIRTTMFTTSNYCPNCGAVMRKDKTDEDQTVQGL